MTQEAAAPEVTKAKTEYETVAMTDGREVKFAGKRQTDKTIILSGDGSVTVRFDFRNGQTRSISSTELPAETLAQALGHGIAQKAGDEYSGVKEIDDMVLAVETIFDRLRKGEWAVERASSGESFSGASIVIRALCEHTGKSVEAIKEFLQKKLDAAKAKGEKLSRQDLYNSFKAPSSPVAAIIKRLEDEARAKTAKASASDLLDELNAA